jgi:hypothetical protein
MDDFVFRQYFLVMFTCKCDILYSMRFRMSSMPDVEGVIWIKESHEMVRRWVVLIWIVAHVKSSSKSVIWEIHITVCKWK